MTDQTDGTPAEAEPAAPGMGPTWTRRGDLAPFSPLDGITIRVVAGTRLMAAWVRIEPETTLPLHRHPHEQLGVVIEGAVEVTVGDERRRLAPGDAYAVPPDVPHGGVTRAEGCLVLETFTPPREDYLARASAAASRGPGGVRT